MSSTSAQPQAHAPGTMFLTAFKLSFYAGIDSELCGIGTPVVIREGTEVVVDRQAHRTPTRLLVRTVGDPCLWAWVWTDMLVPPLQEQEQ